MKKFGSKRLLAVLAIPLAFALIASACTFDGETGLQGLHLRPDTNGLTDPDPVNGGTAEMGTFRTRCAWSKVDQIDPLLSPNQATSHHVHTFFGNKNIVPSTQPGSLRNTPAATYSTCSGGNANLSAYWVPTMINIPKWNEALALGDPDVNLVDFGAYLIPTRTFIYYKNGDGINRYHEGGNPNNPLETVGYLEDLHGLTSTEMPADHPFRQQMWRCGSQKEANLEDLTGCGNTVDMHVLFPRCWDGNTGWTINQDHANYGTRVNIGGANGIRYRHCAPGETVLPQIEFSFRFTIPNGLDISDDLAISSDDISLWTYGADPQGPVLPKGATLHGDWMNGWDPAIQEAWTDNCLLDEHHCTQDIGMFQGSLQKLRVQETGFLEP